MTYAITDEQIKSLVSTMYGNIEDPSALHNWYFLLELHGGYESAVADVNPSETAFVHRDKPLLYQFTMQIPQGQFPEEGFSILKKFRESVTNWTSNGDWGMYANYLDTQLDADTAQELYWGENLPRLRRIKATLDPDQVFWNPQDITPQII
jgi:hypothetical protein